MNKPKNILVIYHGKCPDGIGAAWCFYHFSKLLGWPNIKIDYYPAAYYEEPLDLTPYKDVYIVDFSYSADITLKMAKEITGKLTVLDHHQSAIDNLTILNKKRIKNLDLILDLKRSGAQLAWDYLKNRFSPQGEDGDRPWFIDYIGDRDLWNFELPFSRQVNRALGIDYFDATIDNPIEKLNELLLKTPENFIQKGEHYLKMEECLLNDICLKAVKKQFLGYNVYVVEANVLISEVGDYLARKKEVDFVVIWRFNPFKNTYNYSIRCDSDGPDLSIIAKKYGGGGHKQAAGFFTEKFLFGNE